MADDNWLKKLRRSGLAGSAAKNTQEADDRRESGHRMLPGNPVAPKRQQELDEDRAHKEADMSIDAEVKRRKKKPGYDPDR